jgi:hypothetical protein
MSTFKTRMLAILSLIATLGVGNAVAQGPTYFAVPFDFTVGSKSFTAGLYSVREAAPHILQIQSRDGRANMMIPTSTSEPSKYEGLSVINFERYGDRYFLSKFSDVSHEWVVPKSGAEKHLIEAAARQVEPAKQLEVVATTRH